MTTTPASTYRDAIDTIVAQVKAEIGVDIALRVVPETIGCYAELHDYVDANNYADTIVTRLELTRPWSEFINDVTDQVDVWLRAGRPADITACQTGSSWHESTPIHCGEHAETLPPATVTARAAAASHFPALPTVYADCSARERRIALRTDESFRDNDGTYRVALVEEGKRGYIAVPGFADLATAVEFAASHNRYLGLTDDDVLDIYVSSLTC